MRRVILSAFLVFQLSGNAHAQSGRVELDQQDGISLDHLSSQDQSARAQKPAFRANAIIIDLGGPGGLISASFETFFSDDLAVKFGFGVLPAFFGNEMIPIGNIMLNYISDARRSDHHLELGLGLMTIFNFELKEPPLGSATLGYRYQPPNGNQLFHIALTPILTSNGILPWAAIGYGGRF